MKRTFITLTLALAASVAQGQAAYPAKPIKVIVPLAAGSAVDNAARIVTEKMSRNMGVGIVIENQPGAAGLIGAGNVAKAAPDGYTLGGFNDSVMTMVPNMTPKMPWDIVKDFEPVSLVATVEWGLVVNANAPMKTAADLIAAAKKEPGKINYGSGGNGSPQHIAMALFASQAGVQMQHVPYKGATQAAVGVGAGEVLAAFQGISTVKSLMQAGKVRLIGVTTSKRMAQFPDVPTVGESGLQGFEFNSWFAMMAPAGTPKEITNKLAAEVKKALEDPEVKAKLDAQGLTPKGTTPDELAAATKAQFAKYGEVIRRNGISSE
jgi:tripartite-type tricarboxylate transporter receptor subunit TctC